MMETSDFLPIEEAAKRLGKHRDTLDRLLENELSAARAAGREPRFKKYRRPADRRVWVRMSELDKAFEPYPQHDYEFASC